MRYWLLFLGCFLFFARPAGATIALFPVEGTNLEPGEESAIGQMVATAYQIEANNTVLSPEHTAQPLAAAGGYPAAAQQLGAEEYLVVSAVRLKQRVILVATRYRSDGARIHAVKMTASSLDDLEPVSERLARALIRRTSVRETIDSNNVTETEGRKKNRVWVDKIMGLKAGYIFATAFEGTKISPMMNLAYDGRLEGESYFLEFGLGFTVPSANDEDYSYGGLASEIGASLYLLNSSFSPYIGAGVLPRLMGREVTNFAVYGQLGAMFPRESSSRLYIDLRVAQNLTPVGFGTDYDITTGETISRDELYPMEFALYAGIGW